MNKRLPAKVHREIKDKPGLEHFAGDGEAGVKH